MGKIKRQGLSVSLFLYIGLVLGFINTGLLFPRILPPEVYGYTQFLAKVSGLLSVVSLLGLPTLTIRFFPEVRNKTLRHEGYLMALLTTGLILTAIVATLMLIFQEAFIGFFQKEDTARSTDHYIRTFYWGIVAWFVINNMVIMFSAYLTALQRPRVPSFLIEVGGRLVTLSLLLLFFLGVFDQSEFVRLYSVKQSLPLFGMVAFLMLIGEFHWYFTNRLFRKGKWKEWATYSLFSSFTQLGDRLTVSIDTIMITRYLDLAQTGVYNLFQFLATVIMLSHKGMGKIASPMIAEYWSQNRMDKIAELYKRLALNNLVVAVLVYIGILANLDNAILFYGETYEAGRSVAIFIGAAQLLHVINGYNGLILIYSPKYRYTFYFKILTVALAVVTNIVFIQRYGIAGAAMATALTILLTNTLNQWFVYREFGMHAFSRGMLVILGIGALVLIMSYWVPRLSPGAFLDAGLRSVGIVVLYSALILWTGVAPDINQFVQAQWLRLRKRFNR